MLYLDRRTFLAMSGLAVAGLATGCRNSGDADPGGPPSINDIITQSEQLKRGRVNVVQALGEVLTRPDARVTFALIDAQDTTGQKRLTGGTVRVYAAKDADAPALGPVEATYHDEGLVDTHGVSKGIYVVRLKIDTPGTWLLLAVGKPDGAAGELFGGASYPAVARVSGPAPGAKSISVATPTTADKRGVNPICTRVDDESKPSPCSMHAVSLDVALASGKPTVFNIGTPKFCQSRVCGPVIDVIQTVGTEFAGRVNFVHAEVYKDDSADTIQRQLLAPAPAAWGLSEEPVTYWIRADGTVTERVVGPVDVAEVRDLTSALL
ncbi:MAG: hypothetical protein ACRDKG_11300 [Actinomycetota bacterium]